MDSLSSFNAEPKPQRPWRRSKDGIVGGVCAGLAGQLGIPAWVIRAAWLVAVFCFGTGLLFYAAFWFCLPREDDPADGLNKKVFGVCARIGRRGDVDVGLARLLALALLVLSAGSAIVGYVVLFFLLPESTSATSSSSFSRPS